MSKEEPQPRQGLARWFEALVASAALILLSPVLIVLAVVIRLTSPGPALFRQQRLGQEGTSFSLLKFRSMTAEQRRSDTQRSTALVTASNDLRVTPVGRVLRATKLDELPELINVARGDMSLVGPRPEVGQYADLSDPEWQRLLSIRPGLTNETTLLLRNEEQVLLLGGTATDLAPEEFYTEHLLPFKIRHSIAASSQRSGWNDIKILLLTLGAIVGMGRRTSPSEVVQEVLSRVNQEAAHKTPSTHEQ